MNWTTELSIMDNGQKKAYVREKVYRYGKMAVNTKGIGKMIELMGMEDSFIPTATATTANGSTTKPMAVAPTNTWMEPNTSAIGKKINNTVTESKLGQTKLSTKATMNSERNTVSALLSGLINQLILENSTTIIFMGKVSTLGLTAVSMKENGEQTKCMGKELSVGQMDENTSGSMPKTRNVVTANSSGPIDVVTEVNG